MAYHVEKKMNQIEQTQKIDGQTASQDAVGCLKKILL